MPKGFTLRDGVLIPVTGDTSLFTAVGATRGGASGSYFYSNGLRPRRAP